MSGLAIVLIAIGAPGDDAQAKRRLGGSWDQSAKRQHHPTDERGAQTNITLPGATLRSTASKPTQVLKVVELPNVAEFQRDDGSYVDLGWRFLGETGGEWVGYIGNDTDYLTVSPEQLTAIMQIAGITKLPEPPTHLEQLAEVSNGGDTEFGNALWVLLLAAASAFILRAARRRLLPDHQIGDPKRAAEIAADWMTTAERRMASASASRPHRQMRTSTVVRGGSPAFGRRA